MAGTFEIYQDRAGKWRWFLRGATGRTVVVGGVHESPNGARKQCELVQSSCVGAVVEEVQ